MHMTVSALSATEPRRCWRVSIRGEGAHGNKSLGGEEPNVATLEAFVGAVEFRCGQAQGILDEISVRGPCSQLGPADIAPEIGTARCPPELVAPDPSDHGVCL